MRLVFALLLSLLAAMAAAQEQRLVLASTTSTQNSGLYDYLLPLFTRDTGIAVNVVAVGTGQALRIARNGDADVLIVHHRPSEDQFIADGFGIDRRDLMYNDFVIVGPRNDPAGIATANTATGAFARIANTRAPFISRGDNSGTDYKEQEIWRKTGLAPQGRWYREIGAGMGAALNMTAATDAYVLTDRGTWLSFNNKADLALLFKGDDSLFNPYGILTVNPAKFPHVRADLAKTFSDWLTGPRGQSLIAGFQVQGQTLFCPSASASSCPGLANPAKAMQ